MAAASRHDRSCSPSSVTAERRLVDCPVGDGRTLGGIAAGPIAQVEPRRERDVLGPAFRYCDARPRSAGAPLDRQSTRRPMSFVSPMKNRSSTTTIPTTRDALVDLAPDGPAADAFDEREGDVAAVERQQRQQVEQGEREADQRRAPRDSCPCPARPPPTSPGRSRRGSRPRSPSPVTSRPSDRRSPSSLPRSPGTTRRSRR